MCPACFDRSFCLLDVFFRAVVPHAHAHVLPIGRLVFGDGGAVELGHQTGLRIEARIGPCHVRAVPSSAGIVLAGTVVLAVLVGAAALTVVLIVVFAGVPAVVFAVVLCRHTYHLGGSMPGRARDMHRAEKLAPEGDFS